MSSPIVKVGIDVTVDDVSKMFDLDTSTYTTFNTTNSSLYVNIYFKKPAKIKELVMLLGANAPTSADFLYADDTDSSSYGYTGFLTIVSYNGVGGASYAGQVANPLPDKEITGIKFTMSPDTSGNVYVYELYAYKGLPDEMSKRVYSHTVTVPEFVSSGEEEAYNFIDFRTSQLVRGAEFADVTDFHSNGSITVANGGYIELGGA